VRHVDLALVLLGALCLVAAVAAHLAGHIEAFNFLCAAGVLLLLVVAFDRWWKGARRRRHRGRRD
jgi:NADH:ubiquinone oxidoreductase subunit 6 (subunit J)